MTTINQLDAPLVSDDWRIQGRVYRDQAIFDAEQRTVFRRSWIFVAHESEIPSGGDYKTAWIGLQPVIVSRGADDGEVHVLFNRCRHRGSAVCQREYGNANAFRCAYHGWTYASNGDLIGVPYADGYGDDFDKRAMGLVRVPHVASYRGFVFASIDPDVPDLETYLGHGRRYLDFVADVGGGNGVELGANVQKYVYRGNWKLQLENTIDPYHVAFTHKSWLDIMKQRTGRQSEWSQNVKSNPEWRGLDLGGGHAVHEYASIDERDEGRRREAGGGGVGIGELLPFGFICFPTLAFLAAQLRLVIPRGVDRTDVYLYPLVPTGSDDEERSRILRSHESFYGPAGAGSADDIEVGFERVMSGLSASATSEDWVLMSRGLHRELVDEETGIRIGRSSDEVPQRAFYRRWLELVSDDDAA